MTTTNNTALRTAKRRALKLAEFRLTNESDKTNCENDLMRNIGLSPSEAKIVSASYRAQVLPAVAQHEGLQADYDKLVRLCGLEGRIPMPPTADFAKGAGPKKGPADIDDDIEDEDELFDDPEGLDDEDEAPHKSPIGDKIGGDFHNSLDDADDDESPEFGSIEDSNEDDFNSPMHGEDPSTFGDDNGLGEDLNEGGKDTAVVEIEVPLDQLDAFNQLLEDFKASQSGGEDDDLGDLNDDTEMEDEAPIEAPSVPDHAEETAEKRFPLAARKAPTMSSKTDKDLAARRAMRQRIMDRIASSEENTKRDIGLGKDTSEGTYMGEKSTPIKKSGDAQYASEKKFPQVTLDSSGGNSLQKDNPKFNKLKIPTRNPENLGLKDSYEAVRKEGDNAGEKGLEYEVDLDKLDWVPSAEGREGEPFAIPTQMEQRERNTTTNGTGRDASVGGYQVSEIEAAEEALYKALRTAGVSEEEIAPMTMAQAIVRLANTGEDVAIVVNAEEAETPAENKGNKLKDDDFKRKPHATDESRSAQASDKSGEVFRARLKTASAITMKLVKAGLIDEADMEKNVDMWMNDGLSVQSMISTGTQFLRMASSASERVLEAASNKTNIRTAGIATNPVITPTNNAPQNYGGNSDLGQALRTALHNDEYDMYDREVRERSKSRY
jgi:hypothetical protein